jgi:transcriptional regulator with XRE-family HTH domain
MSDKSANTAKIYGDKFQEFIADDKRRLLYERESLAFDSAEMIAHLMVERKMNKAQLARAIGKSRAYVTQLLSGSRNMTIHTLADLGLALGYRFELKARQCKAENAQTEAKTDSLYQFSKPPRYVRETGKQERRVVSSRP